MSIGYACHAMAVPGSGIKKCLLRNADTHRLQELIGANLDALDRMVAYNIANGIMLYRISSDIVPFASSPVNDLPWESRFQERLTNIGRKIKESGMRVSMHPGQYTVLNSPDERTVENAVSELQYHARFLDSLGVDGQHKIVLHVGGVYGDKREAVRRFLTRLDRMEEAVRRRLVIENDDRSYCVSDVLDISAQAGIPVIFDNLHHAANPPPEAAPEVEWINRCGQTWKPRDGRQKIHYAQQEPGKKAGAHSLSIRADEFLAFHGRLGPQVPDIMLEVKDKNISARKCSLLTTADTRIGELEREWARCKYLVLERSQAAYLEIRGLLKDKSAYPALTFYRLIEQGLSSGPDAGSAENAANHVWGYFKDLAEPAERARYARALEGFKEGETSIQTVKRILYTLAQRYQQDYLLESYYFC